jgi:hypothetical protein
LRQKEIISTSSAVWHLVCWLFEYLTIVNAPKTNQLRISPTAQPGSRLVSPTMYLLRLRAHLSRGRIALGEVIEAVGDALPVPRARKNGRIGDR